MKHLNIALSQYGIKEIKGNRDNIEVLKYFDALCYDGSKLKDETSWCAAFANWVLKESGLSYQKTLNARSFLTLGEKVNNPVIGDIVVFWRESKDSWKGHVGFFISETENYINVLGGNQNNKVCIQPYHKGRLLNYIRIK